MFANTSLKNFQALANTLEKEYKNPGVIKLYDKLFELCRSQNTSDLECRNLVPKAQVVIQSIWDMKHKSKSKILNAMVKTIDKTQPIKLGPEQQQVVTSFNNLQHQQDIYGTKLIRQDRQTIQKLYNQAKQLVNSINKNYNDYYYTWQKMKDLEEQYIRGYDKYIAYKKEYENQINIPSKVINDSKEIYKNLTTQVIPKFKTLNANLDKNIQERYELVQKFYNIYLSLSPQELQSVSIPLTVFDIHKKMYSKMKYPKPKAHVTECIKKSWKDAVQEGFNTTFFAPCHIIKQNDVIKCDNKYDWPYIEYEPNVFSPWNPEQKYNEWINTCIRLEGNQRPFIGI